MLDIDHHDLLREFKKHSSMRINQIAFDDYNSVCSYMSRHRGRKNYIGEKTKKIAYNTNLIEKNDSIDLTYFDNTICKFFPDYNQYFSTYYSNHHSTNRRLFSTGLVTGKRNLHSNSSISNINLCRHLMNSRIRVLEEGTIISTKAKAEDKESRIIISDEDKSKLEDFIIKRYLFTKSSVNKYLSFHKKEVGFDVSILVKRGNERLEWLATFGLFNQIKLLRTRKEDIDSINDLILNSTISQDDAEYGIIELNTKMGLKDYLNKFKT